MKRITGLILVLALTLSLLTGIFSIPVSAVDSNGNITTYDKITTLEKHVDIDALVNLLKEKLTNCEGPVDISGFNIPLADAEGIYDLIWKGMPEMFHISGLGVSYNESSATLISINVLYSMTKEEYAAARAGFDARTEELLAGVKDNDSLSDVEKALILHDRLAASCMYDYTYQNVNAYNSLVDRTSVCEGYTMAYIHLLRQVGIKSYYCDSTTLNHSWNLVIIDGKAYHTDVTWDSFIGYMTGYVTHENFMLSTDGIKASGHSSSDFEVLPTDKTYESGFWASTESEIVLLGNEIYYIDNSTAKLIRRSDGKELVDLNAMWRIGTGSSYYPGCYSRLSTDGHYLYYNKCEDIYRYDPATGESVSVYNTGAEGNNVWGFRYEDGNLVFEKSDKGINKFYTSPPPCGEYTERVPYVAPVPELELKGVAVALYSDLTFRVFTSETIASYYDDISVDFTMNGSTVSVSDYMVRKGGYYFSLSKITPDKMTDDITMTIHGKIGTTEYTADPVTFSIEEYCTGMIANSQMQELTDLLKDLLNYGAAAQTYTGHNIETLANRNLDDDDKARADEAFRAPADVSTMSIETVSSPVVTWKSAGLNLRESIAMRYVFSVEGGDTSGIEIRVTDEDGKLLSRITEFKKTGSDYYVLFSRFNASNIDKPVLVTAYKDGAAISNTMRYSIESYAAIAELYPELAPVYLTRAMMNYGISAAAFVTAATNG